MSSENVAVEVDSLCKCYQLYNAPADRLKQALMPRLQRFAGIPAKSYFREFWALRNVSFQALQGETVGIIGRNGSGKSTLLQIITGTLMQTSGRVVANGRVAALLELGAGFNPEFSGRENVYLNAALLGLSREETDARFEEIAEFAGIGDFLEAPVKTYSSGMYVRLAFAVAACVEPDILIIDEALSVGDAAFQFRCLKRIEMLQEKGVTLLFVSHDMNMVQKFCQRVIYLEQGQIKSIGDPEGVAARYFFDTREAQRLSLGGLAPYQMETALGNSAQSNAFGNGLGKIVMARFEPGGGTSDVFARGEPIRLVLDLVYTAVEEGEVALAVSVDNSRLITLTGRFLPLSPNAETQERRFEVEIPNYFNVDSYFITLRLMQRVGWRQFLPVQSQLAALHFQVNLPPGDYPSPGYFLTDMRIQEKSSVGMEDHSGSQAALSKVARGRKRVVALLAVRNEAPYIDRCLRHLSGQGVETYVIDNQSTDATIAIASEWMGKGVIGIDTLDYPGYFDLQGQLLKKTELCKTLDADWFIHHDADEIRQSRIPGETLVQAIERLEKGGANAIEFDEYVFLPPEDWESDQLPADFVAEFRYAYYYHPRSQYRVNAWKNGGSAIDLLATAGHEVCFEGRCLPEERLILRHYPFLSRRHLIEKYARERVYSPYETQVLGWHASRKVFRPELVKIPGIGELLEPDRQGWVTSNPWKCHPFLSGKAA